MNELEHKILTHLKSHHRGKENAITFKALSIELRINSRLLRKSTAGLVKNGEGCIGTTNTDGYFYVVTDEEFDHCQNYYKSYAMEMLLRRKGQRKARINDKQEHPQQQRLFAEVM